LVRPGSLWEDRGAGAQASNFWQRGDERRTEYAEVQLDIG